MVHLPSPYDMTTHATVVGIQTKDQLTQKLNKRIKKFTTKCDCDYF